MADQTETRTSVADKASFGISLQVNPSDMRGWTAARKAKLLAAFSTALAVLNEDEPPT
jgi:hypothetical protein